MSSSYGIPHDSVYFNIKPKLHQKNLPNDQASNLARIPLDSPVPRLGLIVVLHVTLDVLRFDHLAVMNQQYSSTSLQKYNRLGYAACCVISPRESLTARV
jgi:hypothetical protein